MIKEALRKLADKKGLSRAEAYETMNDIMTGQASDSAISGFLMALRVKGESPEEIAGCAQSMREKSVRIQTKHKDVIDTCGTGGDASGTFNISTTAAIIASAAGAVVAKHGNRAVSSRCGSADVLRALGVNIDIPPEKVSRVLDDVGITFLFAPMMHQAMKYAAGVRKDLGIRTIFNILGPLTNPAGARRHLMGVFHPALTEIMAAVLQQLGTDHALVVHGEGGFDELTTLGTSKVSELRNGEVRTYTLHPSDVGVEVTSMEGLKGGDAEENAALTRRILEGHNGASREIALLNAGAGIFVAGKTSSIKEGIAMARQVIDSGKAKKKLQEWIDATNS